MVEISVSGVTGGRWKRAVARIEAPDAVVGKQRLPEPQYRANAPTQVDDAVTVSLIGPVISRSSERERHLIVIGPADPLLAI
jgi:hypothetical protein